MLPKISEGQFYFMIFFFKLKTITKELHKTTEEEEKKPLGIRGNSLIYKIMSQNIMRPPKPFTMSLTSQYFNNIYPISVKKISRIKISRILNNIPPFKFTLTHLID